MEDAASGRGKDKNDNRGSENGSERFDVLFSLIKTIGSLRNLDQILETVTQELAGVMGVKAVSVKLLSDDGTHLTYKGAFGLPQYFITDRTVDLAMSPLNRGIIEGEPFTAGQLTEQTRFQFGEDLAAARIQSVLFVPLSVEERIIGVLGAYCRKPDRFSDRDIEFFRMAAGLVAIAIDNSRAYESVEKMSAERSRFLLRVAHNLRAPLAAVTSMLEILKDQLLGPLNPDQAEYVRRVDRRIRTMLTMINDLLDLSARKTLKAKQEKTALDIAWLSGRLTRTFQDEAVERGILFEVSAKDNPAPILGVSEMIEQMLENLVSNAIKYTPSGGTVKVIFFPFDPGMTALLVQDTGIGIPEEDLPSLFGEFFRASNARKKEELGTGLGLAIVKEIVSAHQGRISVESSQGKGAIFKVVLPSALPPRPLQPS